jgi:hypothetical protein
MSTSASSLAGDTAKARKAFQDFFELWKGGTREIDLGVELFCFDGT